MVLNIKDLRLGVDLLIYASSIPSVFAALGCDSGWRLELTHHHPKIVGVQQSLDSSHLSGEKADELYLLNSFITKAVVCVTQSNSKVPQTETSKIIIQKNDLCRSWGIECCNNQSLRRDFKMVGYKFYYRFVVLRDNCVTHCVMSCVTELFTSHADTVEQSGGDELNSLSTFSLWFSFLNHDLWFIITLTAQRCSSSNQLFLHFFALLTVWNPKRWLDTTFSCLIPIRQHWVSAVTDINPLQPFPLC